MPIIASTTTVTIEEFRSPNFKSSLKLRHEKNDQRKRHKAIVHKNRATYNIKALFPEMRPIVLRPKSVKPMPTQKLRKMTGDAISSANALSCEYRLYKTRKAANPKQAAAKIQKTMVRIGRRDLMDGRFCGSLMLCSPLTPCAANQRDQYGT